MIPTARGDSGADREPSPSRRRGVVLACFRTGGGPGDASRALRRLRRLRVVRPRWIRSAAWPAPLRSDTGDRWTIPLQVMAGVAEALAEALPEGWQVFTAAHSDGPAIDRVVKRMAAAALHDVVVVPIYPQFSGGLSGAILRQLFRALATIGSPLSIATRTVWGDDDGYVTAQARLLQDHACARDLRPRESHLFFAVHAPPHVPSGDRDPYAQQVRQTIDLVVQRLGWPPERVTWAFHEARGPSRRRQQDALETLRTLAREGATKVLGCVIGQPVADPAAVDALAGEYRQAFGTGERRLTLCPPMNRYPPFVAALRNLVLRGSRPATPRQLPPVVAPSRRVAVAPASRRSETLVAVGISLPGAVPAEHGPRLRFSRSEPFQRSRKSRKELRYFLECTREVPNVAEVFVWNTCQRMECYAFLEHPGDVPGRECTVASLRSRLVSAEPDGLEVNVLFGADAWHHLLRTAAGLNSHLPGDLDVLAQLQTARHIAEHVGVAGPRTAALVDRVAELIQQGREETAWGRVSTGYCFAAISHLFRTEEIDPGRRRHLVIGGSTTSRSILAALRSAFRVPEDLLTVVYRGHHGQMRLLRSAIGRGKRLRVHAYSERVALEAIAAADIAYFGIDQAEPVLQPSLLSGLRDFGERPLTLADFNTFGSMGSDPVPDGVTQWDAEALGRAITEHARAVRADPVFPAAVTQMEAWIETAVFAERSGALEGA